jgi:citrate lyase subunit beta-like protein
MHARRAFLYVPGDDRHKAEKAADLAADCICLDLEDGVAINRKDAARHEVVKSLQTLDFHDSERLVRVNSRPSGLCERDLEVILPARPDGVYLPKVDEAADIQWINEQLQAFEERDGLDAGAITLVAGIESALAILNLVEICRVTERLSGIVFGAEDYMADIGGIRTPEGEAIFYARSMVVTCAVAFTLQAIDMVCTDYLDGERLSAECRNGVALGFAGKQVIHPAQVKLVQDAFTPDAASIQQAEMILKAYRDNLVDGKGAFVLDGKMVDMPVVKAAERLLARVDKITRIGA